MYIDGVYFLNHVIGYFAILLYFLGGITGALSMAAASRSRLDWLAILFSMGSCWGFFFLYPRYIVIGDFVRDDLIWASFHIMSGISSLAFHLIYLRKRVRRLGAYDAPDNENPGTDN